MIAIPNMEKPSCCGLCQLCLNDSRIANGYCMFFHRTVNMMELDKACPLIEIATCGECKYMRKYALRSDEPTGIWCHRWSIPRLVTDDDFCSYGERRADDKEIL